MMEIKILNEQSVPKKEPVKIERRQQGPKKKPEPKPAKEEKQ